MSSPGYFSGLVLELPLFVLTMCLFETACILTTIDMVCPNILRFFLFLVKVVFSRHK